jgi:hypothetical protein
MKKILLTAAMVSAIAATAMAVPQDKPVKPQEPREVSQSAAKAVRGSIVTIDNSMKSVVVKDETSGKEVTVYWDGATKVTGDLKVGGQISLQATEQSGRMVASSIEATGAKKPY